MVLSVGVLGATGTVGQRFVQILNDHPFFRLDVVGASESSAGKTYKQATQWKLSTRIPERVQALTVMLCDPKFFQGCQVIFSALDASVAGPIEEAFAKAGIPVFSNARNWRYDSQVPILVPHANPQHLDIVPFQKKAKEFPGNGYIVTNANCSSTGLVVALKPIMDAFGIEKLIVFTMQAISGAGYPGVSSLDITDNVVPYISGEEPKMEMEPQKMLGSIVDGKFQPADFAVSAHCNRVNVVDGHTECVSIKLRKPNVTPEEVVKVLKEYRTVAQDLKLPSAPPSPVVVLEEENRPQPRLDRDLDGGFVVTVGRVRKCNIFDIKFTLCSHNTVIGAAGGAVMNAELAVAKGHLPKP